jgi:hypothetical protein
LFTRLHLVLMFVALGVVLTPTTARANPVNAEVLLPNPFREGWSGGVDGSFALSRGNIELPDVGGGARVQYQTLHPQPARPEGTAAGVPFIRQRVFLTGSGRFAERADAPFINQAFGQTDHVSSPRRGRLPHFRTARVMAHSRAWGGGDGHA